MRARTAGRSALASAMRVPAHRARPGDWSGRFPLIEAALRNHNSSFVIDGEAVLLGVYGHSDFNGLHTRKHDHEVESMPST